MATAALPTVTSITTSPVTGPLGIGKVLTFTVNLGQAVAVTGGTPTLTLSDGGIAT